MQKILNQRGMAFLSILLALLIVGAMCYFAFKNATRNSDTSNKSFVRDAGVDTSSYKGIIDSTKKIVKDAEADRSE